MQVLPFLELMEVPLREIPSFRWGLRGSTGWGPLTILTVVKGLIT